MRIVLGLAFTVIVGLSSFSLKPVDNPTVVDVAHDTARDTLVNMAKDTLGIKEVIVQGQVQTPEERLAERQQEYRAIYLHGDNSNIATLGAVRLSENFSLPLPVLLVNMNHLYNHLSTSGKQARRSQQILIDDYEKDKIEQVWLPLTAEYTKLEGQELEDFRRYYEPDYPWIVEAEEWEKLDYVFKKLKNYQDSAVYIREALRLP